MQGHERYSKRITNEQIDEILRLLDSGQSQREIAKYLGISRGFITRLLQGTLKKRENEEPSISGWPQGIGIGLINRCPSCGAKVFGGCAACYLRARLRRRKNAIRRKAR